MLKQIEFAQSFFFRSVGARGMLSAPRRSEESGRSFFYVFINFIKKFYTHLRFQNINSLLATAVIHHVNPVMYPGILGEELVSAMALVDNDPDHYRDPEHNLCFFFQQPSVGKVVLASEKLCLE